MKHQYPAIFTKEADGDYSIHFPDLLDCYSQGDNEEYTYVMTQDACALWMAHAEDKELGIPVPSSIDSIHTAADETVTLISCDTDIYHRLWAKTHSC